MIFQLQFGSKEQFSENLKRQIVKKVHSVNYLFYYIPCSEILQFPSVINFDIITSDDINFHFHFLL